MILSKITGTNLSKMFSKESPQCIMLCCMPYKSVWNCSWSERALGSQTQRRTVWGRAVTLAVEGLLLLLGLVRLRRWAESVLSAGVGGGSRLEYRTLRGVGGLLGEGGQLVVAGSSGVDVV